MKTQFSKFIVSVVVAMNILFTIAVLYVFLKIGQEPTVLITCFFGFTTGELLMLGSIKKVKVKNNNTKNVIESEGDNYGN